MDRLPFFLLLLFGLFGDLSISSGEDVGNTAAVVFNSRLPASRNVAEYYAKRRGVPSDQVFGFNLPESETMTRGEFRDQLQKPLFQGLEERKLFRFVTEIEPASRNKPGKLLRRLTASKIRYLVLCYGVPVRVLKDPNLVEEGAENLKPELRRNEAAVDSELALLPVYEKKPPLYGPLRNVFYGVTNASFLHPTNGILLVARLDGPSVEIARGLVDKAIQAETDGLWGRAYFDVRGLTNSTDKVGDDWIRMAEQICRRFGFETVLDQKPETFPAGFPMSHIALYAGWYDANVSGPFTKSSVEFMPGAFAYHLHSFSASSIRTSNQFWVGPLLAKGATATLGCVDEPYLEATPDVAAFFARLLIGFTFGEAAYASQNALSWQTTVVGDPLYRPFGKSMQALHMELMDRRSKLIEWSHLLIVNRNLAMNESPREMSEYLDRQPISRQSAVLQEKLADLYFSQTNISRSIEAYKAALKLEPTPQQQTRILLNLERVLNVFGREQEAFATYQEFLRKFPDYPDLPSIYHKLLPLAHGLGKKEEAELYLSEINRLTGASSGRQ
jgi:uncharacterized protein (TIGR03790 family)